MKGESSELIGKLSSFRGKGPGALSLKDASDEVGAQPSELILTSSAMEEFDTVKASESQVPMLSAVSVTFVENIFLCINTIVILISHLLINE